jgi:hypothetical protein
MRNFYFLTRLLPIIFTFAINAPWFCLFYRADKSAPIEGFGDIACSKQKGDGLEEVFLNGLDKNFEDIHSSYFLWVLPGFSFCTSVMLDSLYGPAQKKLRAFH